MQRIFQRVSREDTDGMATASRLVDSAINPLRDRVLGLGSLLGIQAIMAVDLRP